MFGPSFSVPKCKTQLGLAVGRLKLLLNKKAAAMAALRKEIADLLATGKTDSARIRVEGLLREENLVAAFEILQLLCELLVQRLAIIDRAKAPVPPQELREAITTVMFAATRTIEVPEFDQVRIQFGAKYGKEFSAEAVREETALSAGVNPRVFDLFAVRVPHSELKLARLQAIAKEHNVQWDSASFASSILPAPPDLIDVDPRNPWSPSSPEAASASVGQPGWAPAGGQGSYADAAAAAKAARTAADQAQFAAAAAAELARGHQRGAADTVYDLDTPPPWGHPAPPGPSGQAPGAPGATGVDPTRPVINITLPHGFGAPPPYGYPPGPPPPGYYPPHPGWGPPPPGGFPPPPGGWQQYPPPPPGGWPQHHQPPQQGPPPAAHGRQRPAEGTVGAGEPPGAAPEDAEPAARGEGKGGDAAGVEEAPASAGNGGGDDSAAQGRGETAAAGGAAAAPPPPPGANPFMSEEDNAAAAAAAPAVPPPPSAPPPAAVAPAPAPAPAPAARPGDELDELTKRFEALKKGRI